MREKRKSTYFSLFQETEVPGSIPALPDFLSSSGSGTGSTQLREVKLRSYLNKKVAAQILTAVGNRCANYVTPLYPQKLALTSPTDSGRSVGMVRSRTKATEFSLVFYKHNTMCKHRLNVCKLCLCLATTQHACVPS